MLDIIVYCWKIMINISKLRDDRDAKVAVPIDRKLCLFVLGKWSDDHSSLHSVASSVIRFIGYCKWNGYGKSREKVVFTFFLICLSKLKPGLLFRDGKSVPLTIAVIWLYKKHLINRLHLSSTNFHFSLNINFISDYSWSKRDYRAAFFSENEKKISLKSLLTTKSFSAKYVFSHWYTFRLCSTN